MSNNYLTQEGAQKQTTALSQQQRYSLRLLTMPGAELREFIDKEIESNPVLEPDEGCFAVPSGEGYGEEGGHGLEPYESHRAQQQNRTLREELRFQLLTGDLDLPLRLGEYMIDCLNPNGYLEVEEAAIAGALGLPLPQINHALAKLQKLEPVGVFARNLRECLLLQLAALPQRNPVAEAIVERFLEQAAQNRLPAIAKELGVELAEVKAGFAQIKALNPKPGASFFTEHPQYVVPDLQVRVAEGQVRVTALAGVGVHLNPYYVDRLPLVDDLTRDYLQGAIGRGSLLIRCVEQRRATLLLVAGEAVQRQRQFFLEGGALAPLTMGELAEAVGLHESTISRAVSGKHLRYTGGTMPLSRLFCGSLGGGSTQSAKRRLAELVRAESPQAPLSDEKLSARLAEEGILLSRRGVAKYRDELGIPTSQSRKGW